MVEVDGLRLYQPNVKDESATGDIPIEEWRYSLQLHFEGAQRLH
jgi:hypothetical protein